MGKICAICGKPSGMYPICTVCFKLRDTGEITKCETCGAWYRTKEGCPNCKTAQRAKSEPATVENELTADELTCIICGEPSNGKHFCRDCYYRFRNKEILLRIKKCVFPCGDPLDESYEGVYECDDGHIVKSMPEQTIDNYLCENAIFHGYELPLDVGTEKPLRPDFCLKNYLGKGKDVYLEYFGLKGQPKYDEETAYKVDLYKKNHITVVCMYPKTDAKNLNFSLSRKLQKGKLKEGELNYFEP